MPKTESLQEKLLKLVNTPGDDITDDNYFFRSWSNNAISCCLKKETTKRVLAEKLVMYDESLEMNMNNMIKSPIEHLSKMTLLGP